ncbi:hypothetical protein DPMN_056547 [Dreissena polymorpha]|uniref:Uncharacterized protein n=1 Tax=Dreissena polymorpha TaxID=45954 RepID=A0A9D4HRL8_DREPO|nr:hypothetical protein DPMN_056547 [Dreissena polymorpha]
MLGLGFTAGNIKSGNKGCAAYITAITRSRKEMFVFGRAALSCGIVLATNVKTNSGQDNSGAQVTPFKYRKQNFILSHLVH